MTTLVSVWRMFWDWLTIQFVYTEEDAEAWLRKRERR